MDVLQDYKVIRLLREGGYAKVSLCRKIRGDNANKEYAIKEMKGPDAFNAIETEYMILSRLDHRFIVKLFDNFNIDNYYYFILEYMEGGNLQDLLDCRPEEILSESEAAFYIKELVIGIEYLHANGIMHRDLKPGNILLDKSGHIKICDFGISLDGCEADVRTYDITEGTNFYMSPERLQMCSYGLTVDWYAMGIILCELVTGDVPFDFIDLQRRTNLINLPEDMNPSLRSLIIGLLEDDEVKRLGCGGSIDIKQHPFFNGTSWDMVYAGLEKPPFVIPYDRSAYLVNFLSILEGF